MKSLEYHGLRIGDWTYIQSDICSVAETLRNGEDASEIEGSLFELSASYYNQWRFVLDSYQRLFEIFNELNEKNAERSGDEVISEFDKFLLEYEPEINNYSYLFIISLKSLLDIFICIVDLIQNREIRDEYKLPDFFTFYTDRTKKNINFEIPELQDYLDSKRERESWIRTIKSIRDKIVHRGYLLKPDIGFEKIDKLIVKTRKGTGNGIDEIEIDIGDILAIFLRDIIGIEESVTKILLSSKDDINKITHRSKFKYSELVNQYLTEKMNPDNIC